MSKALDDADLASDATDRRTFDYEVIMVTYHSRRLLENLLPTFPAELPIAVVDNGQGIDGIDQVLRNRSGARYLHGPNRGFGSGANMGVRTSSYEMVIFLNPDCSPSLDQLDALVEHLRADPQLALAGMTTVLPDGSMELGVGGWEPTFTRSVVHALGIHKLFPNSGLWARPERGQHIDLDWLGAACMATRRSTFLELGGFDETYFVYSEDVELGRTIRTAGLRQKLDTNLVAPHLGAESGDVKPRMLVMRAAMMMQYVGRHNGRATTHGLRLALTAGYVARYVMCRLRQHRVLAREHAAYLRGLWFGRPTEEM